MTQFLHGALYRRRCISAEPNGQPDELLCLGTEHYNDKLCVIVRGVDEVAGGIAVWPGDLLAEYDLVAEGALPSTAVPAEGIY
jgi:hypothetical protein